MSLFRPSLESSPSAAPAEAVPPVADPAVGGRIHHTSEILGEAVMDSVSSVRDSLPEQYRAHFETLRQEIIDFTKAHGIPKESLSKPDLLREVTCKLSTQDLERLALLLERFKHLLIYHELKKEEIDPAKAIEYAEEHYHLCEQYDSQVSLLEQVGILKEGAITGIDGHEYPVPTLEQIASRIFECREILETKHDQGFTKLLLVPFGMSLDALTDALKQFLLKYKKDNPTFNLDTDNPLFVLIGYQRADIGDSPDLVYYPQSFDRYNHQGKTKMEILKEQSKGRWAPASTGVAGEKGLGTPGWTVHLLQPSNLDDQDTETPIGFSSIPRQGQGALQEDENHRPPLESGKTPIEYLSILQKAQDDEDSPYHGETGTTPEDWITAFMIHLSETGKPMDNWRNSKESTFYLTGVFFRFSSRVPCVFWDRGNRRAGLSGVGPHARDEYIGLRSSVMI
ncbi:TPA: hypothetical protein DEP34_00840 [Candidatus Uhrbacteria bacterium]|nr:hypothetical protein [Candidatus Uhrbacteria bacterium]